MRSFLLFLFATFSLGCGNSPQVPNNNPTTNAKVSAAPVAIYDYEIVNTYPHDPTAFTQGLEFHEGILYEGTGGKEGDDFFSSLRKVELTSGKILKKHDLSRDYFGEGITILGEKIYQVTWREMTAFEYDLNDFRLLREINYAGQGWGLTNDGTHLIMSDGTHVIRFMNPADFKTVRTIVVKDDKAKPVMELNELEMVKGEIWANVWQSGWILRIDPADGKLLGRVDLNALVNDEQKRNPKADVLNGIAYDKAGDRLFVTGKNWRRLFEIKLTARS